MTIVFDAQPAHTKSVRVAERERVLFHSGQVIGARHGECRWVAFARDLKGLRPSVIQHWRGQFISTNLVCWSYANHKFTTTFAIDGTQPDDPGGCRMELRQEDSFF